MKGITPVIALILLLVIVIVVVGFSFGIFQSLITTSGEAAEGQATSTSQNVQQTVRIEAVDATNTAVTIRNMGTNVITAGSIGVYVGGNIVACNWDGDTDYGDTDDMAVPISANGIEQCDWQTATCAAGTEVKVTSPSGVQTTDNC